MWEGCELLPAQLETLAVRIPLGAFFTFCSAEIVPKSPKKVSARGFSFSFFPGLDTEGIKFLVLFRAPKTQKLGRRHKLFVSPLVSAFLLRFWV